MSQPHDYYRSAADLEQTPEFLDWAQKEFPGFANIFEGLGEAEVPDGISRRQFLALSAAGLALAGAGCYRRPDLQVLPFSQKPEEILAGLPTFYATNIPRPHGTFPVLVESHEGRPTKIEGHPKHSASLGATDAHAQASILDLYSPDRSRDVLHQGKPTTWTAFDDFAAEHFKKLLADNGKGLYFLSETTASPALNAVRDFIRKAVKNDKGEVEAEGVLKDSSWHVFDAIDDANVRKGMQAAFGEPLVARYRFKNADCIVALDADFLGLGPESVRLNRDFAARRRAPADDRLDEWKPNRLYVVESSFTITGSMADHRLRLPASRTIDYAVALGKEIIRQLNPKDRGHAVDALDKLPTPQLEIPQQWIGEVAADLLAHRGKSLVLAGPKQPVAVQVIVHLLNQLLGNRETVDYVPPLEAPLPGLKELLEAADKGEVKTLILLAGNPAFAAPADAEFEKRLKGVETIIRVGMFVDESSALATWHVPQTHFLEEWGDALTADGTYGIVQPLIAPLHEGRSILELLIQWSKFDGAANSKEAKAKVLPLVEKNFLALNPDNDAVRFREFIQRGFADVPPAKAKPAVFDPLKASSAIAQTRLSAPVNDRNWEIVFEQSYALGDGRFAWNTWLLELPDPITKLVWDNAAVMSPASAKALGIKKNGDMVAIETGGRKLEMPVFMLPGHADFSITLNLGFGGKDRIVHAPGGGGFNVFPLRTSDAMHFASAKVTKLAKSYRLATTQEWGTIPEGRDEIIHSETAEHYKHGEHKHPHPNPKENFQAGYAVALEKQHKERIRLDLAHPEELVGHHQWGMVIDLNSCTGCSACVVACQSENNIPVVGKGEVGRNREMHWIRIDRYFSGSDKVKGGLEVEPAENPQVVQQPMMCQHCEAAPCESVCPVNATVHSPEGLNLQVYNRCIGTRYCGNNCPYKVRRFNWFDFNQRQLDELRIPTPFSDKGMAETLKMQKNPDVTVRSRGVMEKCTYCIQRIERAKIGAKLQAAKANYVVPADPAKAGYDLRQEGGRKQVFVPEGTIVPACGQACPSQAIVFGNVADTSSAVYRLKQRQADYLVQGSKNTKPRTSYLPRLRNPNPKMAEGNA